MAAFLFNMPVGWVKPPQTEFENAACWVLQSSTQPTTEGKAANPTSEARKTNRWVSLRSTEPTMDVTSRKGRAAEPFENRQRLQSQKGMTLVEVLVAVAILSIGILAIASMQKTAIMVNMRAFDITEAANIAQSQMEQLVSLPFNDPGLNVGCPPPLTGLAPGVGMTPGYDCTWCISSQNGGKLIQMAVTANGDTSSCGNGGTCGNCDDGGGSGSTITCFDIVAMKATRP